MKKLQSQKGKIASPLAGWYGGKHRIAPWLLSLAPRSHRAYIEVFGGGGSLLFAKSPSYVEVLNDLDGDVTHWWRTLRDPNLREQLIEALTLTPASRPEWECCRRKRLKGIDDPVERARCFFVVFYNSRNCILNHPSFASSGTRTAENVRNRAAAWAHKVDGLWDAIERLRDVQIEQLDFRRLISRYAGPKAWLFCDPPYLHATRTANKTKYQHEMTDNEHEEMLDMAVASRSMIMISGYRSDLYDRKLRGWHRFERDTHVKCATNVCDSGKRRVEVVWTNYEPAEAREAAARSSPCPRSARRA